MTLGIQRRSEIRLWRASQQKRTRSAVAPVSDATAVSSRGAYLLTWRRTARTCSRSRHFQYFPPSMVSIEIEEKDGLCALSRSMGARTPIPSRDIAPRASRRQAILAAEYAGPFCDEKRLMPTRSPSPYPRHVRGGPFFFPVLLSLLYAARISKSSSPARGLVASLVNRVPCRLAPHGRSK